MEEFSPIGSNLFTLSLSSPANAHIPGGELSLGVQSSGRQQVQGAQPPRLAVNGWPAERAGFGAETDKSMHGTDSPETDSDAHENLNEIGLQMRREGGRISLSYLENNFMHTRK